MPVYLGGLGDRGPLMRWTEEDLRMVQERIKNAGNKNRAAGETAINKSNSRRKSVEEKANTRPDGPVDITVISHLRFLRDPDGCFSKYAIDGIVSAGILPGDSLKEIREIRHRQVKASKGTEKTEIIITW